MRIVFMGTPDFSVEILKAIYEAGHDVALAVAQPDKKTGRGRELSEPPVKVYAKGAGIEVFQPERIREEASIEAIRIKRPELIVVAAYGQILPKAILDIPEYGCINVHTSLLPKYRGASPIQQAILNGDKISGVSIMQMDEGMDTGPILLQRSIEIAEKETGGSLFEKLSKLGAGLCLEGIGLLAEGKIEALPQDEAKATHTKLIKKDAGKIDFSLSAIEIERKIRAFTPWPSAFTTYKGKKLKLWAADAQMGGAEKTQEAGTIIAIKDGIYVQCGEGVLVIKELQAEGRKRMDWKSFLNGVKLAEGDCLGG